MNKKLLFVIVCMLCTLSSFAAKITGTVTDAANGAPLPGVLVVIKETNKVAETDDNGKYAFENVDNGTYEIIFNLLTYKKVLQTVSVLSNKDVVQDIKMKGEANALKDVTVKAARTTNTENAVLMEIRKSNLVMNGISAAQISKTMDRNAAEVVKRVPGITIVDNRFIVVRGLSDRYNTVWINDAGAPSSEVNKKSFSFDLIPAGVIDRLLVYKTASPELPGDFAGGMVKLYTSSLPDRNQISVGFQTSISKMTGKPFNYNEPSSKDWLGYDDGKRELPVNAPAYINKNDSTNPALTKAFGKNDWIIKTKKTSPDYRFNLLAANVVNLGKVKLGNTLAVSYSNLSGDTSIQRKTWGETIEHPDYNYLDYRSVNSVTTSAMDNIVAVVGNTKIEFKNLYNQSGKSSITLRHQVPDSAFTDERSYSIGYESRAVYFAQLCGTHKFKSDNTQYNWAIGYTDLFKNIPDLRRIKYVKQFGEDDSMFRAQVANAVDPVNGGGRFFQSLYEHTYSFNHQLSQKIQIRNNIKFEVLAGDYLEYKTRSFNARVLGYTIKPGALANTLTHLPINEIFADSNVGDKTKFRIDEITSLSDQYTAKNTLITGFAMTKFTLLKKLDVSGGVRYEHNTQEAHSFINLDTIDPKVVTKFLLPSVNIAYNLTPKSLVRAAYGKTLNRPEFREWVPFFFYDFDSKDGTYGSLFPTRLQDTLAVCEIQNFDMRWEWYPSGSETVNVGVFYKKFKNPITTMVVQENADSRMLTFANAPEAYSAGIEIEGRKSFDFVDKWLNTKFFKNISFVGNVALIKSEMTMTDTAVQVAKTPLQGQAPYLVNLGVFYQNAANGFQGSIQYNVVGPKMIYLGTKRMSSVGELPFHSLDFVASKTFFKHYELNFGVQNLLDSKLRMNQDTNHDGTFSTKDKEYYYALPGRYYSIGFKVKF